MFEKSFITSGTKTDGILKASKDVVKMFTKLLANVHETFELSEISIEFYLRYFDIIAAAMLNL
jgi:hypothetical protein